MGSANLKSDFEGEVTSYKLQATSYKLQEFSLQVALEVGIGLVSRTRYEGPDTSYKGKDTRIMSAS